MSTTTAALDDAIQRVLANHLATQRLRSQSLQPESQQRKSKATLQALSQVVVARGKDSGSTHKGKGKAARDEEDSVGKERNSKTSFATRSASEPPELSQPSNFVAALRVLKKRNPPSHNRVDESTNRIKRKRDEVALGSVAEALANERHAIPKSLPPTTPQPASALKNKPLDVTTQKDVTQTQVSLDDAGDLEGPVKKKRKKRTVTAEVPEPEPQHVQELAIETHIPTVADIPPASKSLKKRKKKQSAVDSEVALDIDVDEAVHDVSTTQRRNKSVTKAHFHPQDDVPPEQNSKNRKKRQSAVETSLVPEPAFDVDVDPAATQKHQESVTKALIQPPPAIPTEMKSSKKRNKKQTAFEPAVTPDIDIEDAVHVDNAPIATQKHRKSMTNADVQVQDDVPPEQNSKERKKKRLMVEPSHVTNIPSDIEDPEPATTQKHQESVTKALDQPTAVLPPEHTVTKKRKKKQPVVETIVVPEFAPDIDVDPATTQKHHESVMRVDVQPTADMPPEAKSSKKRIKKRSVVETSHGPGLTPDVAAVDGDDLRRTTEQHQESPMKVRFQAPAQEQPERHVTKKRKKKQSVVETSRDTELVPDIGGDEAEYIDVLPITTQKSDKKRKKVNTNVTSGHVRSEIVGEPSEVPSLELEKMTSIPSPLANTPVKKPKRKFMKKIQQLIIDSTQVPLTVPGSEATSLDPPVVDPTPTVLAESESPKKKKRPKKPKGNLPQQLVGVANNSEIMHASQTARNEVSDTELVQVDHPLKNQRNDTHNVSQSSNVEISDVVTAHDPVPLTVAPSPLKKGKRKQIKRNPPTTIPSQVVQESGEESYPATPAEQTKTAVHGDQEPIMALEDVVTVYMNGYSAAKRRQVSNSNAKSVGRRSLVSSSRSKLPTSPLDRRNVESAEEIDEIEETQPQPVKLKDLPITMPATRTPDSQMKNRHDQAVQCEKSLESIVPLKQGRYIVTLPDTLGDRSDLLKKLDDVLRLALMEGLVIRESSPQVEPLERALPSSKVTAQPRSKDVVESTLTSQTKTSKKDLYPSSSITLPRDLTKLGANDVSKSTTTKNLDLPPDGNNRSHVLQQSNVSSSIGTNIAQARQVMPRSEVMTILATLDSSESDDDESQSDSQQTSDNEEDEDKTLRRSLRRPRRNAGSSPEADVSDSSHDVHDDVIISAPQNGNPQISTSRKNVDNSTAMIEPGHGSRDQSAPEMQDMLPEVPEEAGSTIQDSAQPPEIVALAPEHVEELGSNSSLVSRIGEAATPSQLCDAINRTVNGALHIVEQERDGVGLRYSASATQTPEDETINGLEDTSEGHEASMEDLSAHDVESVPSEETSVQGEVRTLSDQNDDDESLDKLASQHELKGVNNKGQKQDSIRSVTPTRISTVSLFNAPSSAATGRNTSPKRVLRSSKQIGNGSSPLKLVSIGSSQALPLPPMKQVPTWLVDDTQQSNEQSLEKNEPAMVNAKVDTRGKLETSNSNIEPEPLLIRPQNESTQSDAVDMNDSLDTLKQNPDVGGSDVEVANLDSSFGRDEFPSLPASPEEEQNGDVLPLRSQSLTPATLALNGSNVIPKSSPGLFSRPKTSALRGNGQSEQTPKSSIRRPGSVRRGLSEMDPSILTSIMRSKSRLTQLKNQDGNEDESEESSEESSSSSGSDDEGHKGKSSIPKSKRAGFRLFNSTPTTSNNLKQFELGRNRKSILSELDKRQRRVSELKTGKCS